MVMEAFKELFWAIATSMVDLIIPVFAIWLTFSLMSSFLFDRRG